MCTTLPAPTSEPCPTKVAPDPTTDTPDIALEIVLPALAGPPSPTLSETSMPPLDGPEDLDEMEEVVAEGQGVVCAVTPTPKMDRNR